MAVKASKLGGAMMHSKHRKKAVLINVPVPEIEDDKRQPPGGLVSIATCASQEGYEVVVSDLAGMLCSDLCSAIPEADVFGFATYSVTYSRVLALVKELRRRLPNAFYVAGGPHASALPDEVKVDFDCVVCGEGEEAFVSILDTVERGDTSQIPKIIRAEPIANLDSLPFPNFYRFSDIHSYTRRLGGNPVICLDSSRGCNHRCRFCNSRVVERGRWRARSPESVVAEVKWHHSKGWLAFRFNDDNFLADNERALKICELLRPLSIKFRIFARAESLYPELCEALALAGCIHIGVGIESMSPTMLARMGKATRVNRIRSGLQAARDAGISIRGFFICGFPGETDKTVAESIDALEGLALDEAVVYPCLPYPGTDLFAQPERYGITWIDSDYSKFVQVGVNKSTGFVMQTNTFGPDEVRTWREQYMKVFMQLGISWCDEKKIVI